LIYQDSFNDLKNEVTIFLFSYNFEKSIEKSLDSILSQIISIPIKIYCIDDGSNDGTQKILKRYSEKNKNIKLILSNTNTKLPINLVLKSNIDFNSKYFCLLDGDDYWIDDYNLQKKLEVLINNEKLIGCSSITKMINKNNVTLIKADKKLFNKTDIILYENKCPFYCHTSSLLWKNYFYNKKTKLPFPKHYGYDADGDYFLFHQMLDRGHQIYVINDVMSVYNYTGKGVWSSLKKKTQDKLNKDINKKIFYYSAFNYKVLYLLFYLYKFLILKNCKLIKKFFKILEA
jgi:glycosyltransferase involved in cell wall biosynthesis